MAKLAHELLAAALREMVPRAVAVAATTLDLPQPPLAPMEVRTTHTMAPGRLREFAAGRAAARAALATLGEGEFAVGVGPQREPLWPRGVVGSIAHSGNYAIAGAASAVVMEGLGIDLEAATPLDANLVHRVCLPAEVQRLSLSENPALWAKVVFSAKESVYKCLWPRTAMFLEFEDLEIEFDATGRCFRTIGRGRLEGYPVEGLQGRLALRHGLVLTAAFEPAAARPRTR